MQAMRPFHSLNTGQKAVDAKLMQGLGEEEEHVKNAKDFLITDQETSLSFSWKK